MDDLLAAMGEHVGLRKEVLEHGAEELQAVVAATRACVEREYGERAPAAAELRVALERVLALPVPPL